MSTVKKTPDSQIDHAAAVAYWSATEATVSGVLGGYPAVSRIDLQGSSNFLTKLRRREGQTTSTKLERAVDCGAGIGRITDGLLDKHAKTVDIVEPVKKFTDQIQSGSLGRIFNVGLENWFPENEGCEPYDLIWNQWCLSQITDIQVIDYLKRIQSSLKKKGWIVVKENLSHDLTGDEYDATDSSVTRTDTKFRALFEKAGLKIVSTELQRGMPQELFAVRSYALRPAR